MGTPVSSTNKTDRHDMTEILLNVNHSHSNPIVVGRYIVVNELIIIQLYDLMKK